MSEQLYKKKGRKYIPIGYSDGFTGFPTEGIWVVYDRPSAKSMTCIAQVGEFQPIDYELLGNLVAEKETVCIQKVLRIQEAGKWSTYDIVKTVFEELCRHE